MRETFTSYQSIKRWYDKNYTCYLESIDKLQSFHEMVLKSVFAITLKDMIKQYGPPPCEFSWFVMGSAGRCEQAVVSDQDHGIIYKEQGTTQITYFLTFGKKLMQALAYIGFPICDGNVMSSNPIWCRSEKEWEAQINHWIQENSWQSLRYILIFMDARVVVGDKKQLATLKKLVYQMIEQQPSILERLLENTKFKIDAIGIVNQFLPITTGPYSGCINIKLTALFPYVNAIRLLAIIEKIEATSTLSRIEALGLYDQYKVMMETHIDNFKKLMQMRISKKEITHYEDTHYLNIKSLTKLEKKKLKQIFKDLKVLQKYTKLRVQEVVSNEK